MSSLRTHPFVYLDNNATSPCAPEVLAEMLPYFTVEIGNPSSPHRAGRAAEAAVLRAREEVGATVGVESNRVIFTSGATEANNLAILGGVRRDEKRFKIVVSTIEHKSVSLPAAELAKRGYTVVPLPVDACGVVSLDAAGQLIDSETQLVCVQAVNNETGAIQPIEEILEITHGHGALLHCDAVQALGKIAFNVTDLEVDSASFSAHKAYGPKGIGALVLGPRFKGHSLAPLMFGGGQEEKRRPGTLNVPAIVGFGCACRFASSWLEQDTARISKLREVTESVLIERIPNARVNARGTRRVAGTISLTLPGIPADMLIANLPDVCIGEGSACNSGALEPSHVLLAMGVGRSDAECTCRISLSRYTTESELHYAADQVAEVASRLSTWLSAQ